MEVIEGVEKATDVTDLESKFCDITTSDYMVVYLRLLTSGKLQEKTEFFMNFIDGGLSVKEFCNQVNYFLFKMAIFLFNSNCY
jgi:ubiquitin thioesterase protein OTUB1